MKLYYIVYFYIHIIMTLYTTVIICPVAKT